MVAGLVVNWAQIPMPDFIFDPIKMVGDSLVPLLLILLGMQLTEVRFRGYMRTAVVAGRHSAGACPPSWLPASPPLLGLTGVTRQAMIAEASMPSAIIGLILAQEFNCHPQPGDRHHLRDHGGLHAHAYRGAEPALAASSPPHGPTRCHTHPAPSGPGPVTKAALRAALQTLRARDARRMRPKALECAAERSRAALFSVTLAKAALRAALQALALALRDTSRSRPLTVAVPHPHSKRFALAQPFAHTASNVARRPPLPAVGKGAGGLGPDPPHSKRFALARLPVGVLSARAYCFLPPGPL